MTDRLLTTREVATILHCHQDTVLRKVAKRSIPAFKLDTGEIRYWESEIHAWIEKHRIGSAA